MTKRILDSPERQHEGRRPTPSVGRGAAHAVPGAEGDAGASDEPNEVVRLAHQILGRENPIDKQIVARLREAPARYRDLKPLLEGRSDNILTVALDRLEDDGLIKRRSDASQAPVVHRYVLTELGRQVAGAMDLLTRAAARLGRP